MNAFFDFDDLCELFLFGAASNNAAAIESDGWELFA